MCEARQPCVQYQQTCMTVHVYQEAPNAKRASSDAASCTTHMRNSISCPLHTEGLMIVSFKHPTKAKRPQVIKLSFGCHVPQLWSSSSCCLPHQSHHPMARSAGCPGARKCCGVSWRVCRDIAVQGAIGPKFWDRVWFKVLSRVLFSSMYELCLDLAVGKAHAYLH